VNVILPPTAPSSPSSLDAYSGNPSSSSEVTDAEDELHSFSVRKIEPYAASSKTAVSKGGGGTELTVLGAIVATAAEAANDGTDDAGRGSGISFFNGGLWGEGSAEEVGADAAPFLTPVRFRFVFIIGGLQYTD
jgi:hypothetical protein